MSIKPQPKWELVIAVCYQELHIYAETNDALEWIHSEAPAYGVLDLTLYQYSGSMLLRLKPSYDANEVALYLAKMGGEDTASSQITYLGQQVYPFPAPVLPGNSVATGSPAGDERTANGEGER